MSKGDRNDSEDVGNGVDDLFNESMSAVFQDLVEE
jgi:hypothetical protein